MTRYFAELDPNNVVLRVIVCNDPHWIEDRLGGVWAETADPYSPDEQTVAYCGPGHGYDGDWAVRFAPAWVQPVAIHDPEEGQDPWTWYHVGEVVAHNGHLWVSTLNENVWEPGVSGWRRTPTEPGVPPEWIQPTGSHDAYRIYVDDDGVEHPEQVTHNGQVWETLVDSNVWEPGTDDTLWQPVD